MAISQIFQMAITLSTFPSSFWKFTLLPSFLSTCVLGLRELCCGRLALFPSCTLIPLGITVLSLPPLVSKCVTWILLGCLFF